MSRLTALELRRRQLLNRCEEQRLEIAYRIEQIKPREQLTAWSRRSASSSAKSPLAWIAGILGLLLMLRRRRAMAGVGWITGLIALATRTTAILRVLAQLRAIYRGFRATQQR